MDREYLRYALSHGIDDLMRWIEDHPDLPDEDLQELEGILETFEVAREYQRLLLLYIERLQGVRQGTHSSRTADKYE